MLRIPLFFFSLWNYKSSLFGTHVSLDLICRYVLLFYGLSFHFLQVSFEVQNVFLFDKIQYSLFPLLLFVLLFLYLKISCPGTGIGKQPPAMVASYQRARLSLSCSAFDTAPCVCTQEGARMAQDDPGTWALAIHVTPGRIPRLLALTWPGPDRVVTWE